jgi:hypothetical protein
VRITPQLPALFFGQIKFPRLGTGFAQILMGLGPFFCSASEPAVQSWVDNSNRKNYNILE